MTTVERFRFDGYCFAKAATSSRSREEMRAIASWSSGETPA